MPKKKVTGGTVRTPRAFVPVPTALRGAGLSNAARRTASLAKLREVIHNNNEKETA